MGCALRLLTPRQGRGHTPTSPLPPALRPLAFGAHPCPPPSPLRKDKREGGRGAQRESPLLCGAAPCSETEGPLWACPGCYGMCRPLGPWGGGAVQGPEGTRGGPRASVSPSVGDSGGRSTRAQQHRLPGPQGGQAGPEEERIQGAWGFNPPLPPEHDRATPHPCHSGPRCPAARPRCGQLPKALSRQERS